MSDFPTRIFVYGDVRLPDPGEQYSNEQVRQFLASQYFPELAHCKIEVGDEANGSIEVRFIKQATTKGAVTHHPLLQQLLTAPANSFRQHDDTQQLTALLGPTPTLATVLQPELEEPLARLTSLQFGGPHESLLTAKRCMRDLPAVAASFSHSLRRHQLIS